MTSLKKSKKGSFGEAMSEMETVFSILLFLIGVFIVVQYADDPTVKLTYDFENQTYDALANRLLSSGDCFAYMETMTYTGPMHNIPFQIPRPGILDFSKITRQKIEDCIIGVKGYDIILFEDFETTRVEKIFVELSSTEDTQYETFLVQVRYPTEEVKLKLLKLGIQMK